MTPGRFPAAAGWLDRLLLAAFGCGLGVALLLAGQVFRD